MNPPTQPSATPRTDAAYFAEGATMYSLAGEMKLVERELTAAQSMQSLACRKLDEAEKQLAAAKAECERLRTLNDNAGSALQWAKEELARLRADVERWSGGLDMSLPDLYEAAKSERDKAKAQLTAERERVRVLEEAEKEANAKLALYRSRVFRVKSILSSIEDDGTEQHHSATPERKEGEQ